MVIARRGRGGRGRRAVGATPARVPAATAPAAAAAAVAAQAGHGAHGAAAHAPADAPAGPAATVLGQGDLDLAGAQLEAVQGERALGLPVWVEGRAGGRWGEVRGVRVVCVRGGVGGGGGEGRPCPSRAHEGAAAPVGTHPNAKLLAPATARPPARRCGRRLLQRALPPLLRAGPVAASGRGGARHARAPPRRQAFLFESGGCGAARPVWKTRKKKRNSLWVRVLNEAVHRVVARLPVCACVRFREQGSEWGREGRRRPGAGEGRLFVGPLTRQAHPRRAGELSPLWRARPPAAQPPRRPRP